MRAAEEAGLSLDVERVEPLGGGVKSDALRVRLADGSALAFKRYRAEHPRSAEREAAALRLLAGRADLPVPELVAAGDDFVFVTMLPGRLLLDLVDALPDHELRGVYRQIGVFQRALHEIAPDAYGELEPRDGEAIDSAVDAMGHALDSALAAFYDSGGGRRLGSQCVRFFNDHRDALAECVAPALCHLDCHEANILVTRRPGGDLEVTGVIDFDCATAADPMLDLAETNLLARRSGRVTLDALTDGYGELPAAWQERFAVASVARALVLRNWYVKNVSRAGEVHTERRIRRMIGDPGLLARGRRLVSRRND